MKYNIATFALSSLAIILFLSGCTQVTPSEKVLPITWSLENERSSINGTVPEKWIQDDNFNTTVDAFFFSPIEGPEDTFRESVNILRVDLPEYALTSDEYAQTNINGLKANISEFTIDVHEQTTIGKDVPAVRFGYTTSEFGGGPLQFEQLFFVLGNTGYTITYTATPDTFTTFKPDFDALLASITTGN